MKIIDGQGLLLGRVGSYAAKAALLGEEINIINCEKIVVSGEKKKVLAKEKEKRDRKGYPLKSAKFSRLPDRFVRRAVRGMLPHKKERGQEAFKRIKCYVGTPAELKDQAETLAQASASKLPTIKHITVGEICTWLKGGAQ